MKKHTPHAASITLVMHVLSWLAMLSLWACSSYIAPYSHFAYQQGISLKVEALALMEKANEPWADHQQEVQELMLKIEKAFEYAKGRPNNELSTKQWQILKDPEQNLLGGFLKRWSTQSTLSEVFIQEAGGLISNAFDTITGLESGKIKKE